MNTKKLQPLPILYKPSGDSAVVVKLGNSISPETHQKVRALMQLIEDSDIKGIRELVPAYNDLSIVYDPFSVQLDEIIVQVRQLEKQIANVEVPKSRIVEIPVCYDEEFAWDLGEVAQHNNLTENDVIDTHTSDSYLVYMLGFTPGFCYLGGMSDKIATPRKAVPREKIPAGAVGIAGSQTGIYPVESPGGWQIIGKTPYRMFDPKRNPEFLVQAGDTIVFKPISKKAYFDIEKREKNYMMNNNIFNDYERG